MASTKAPGLRSILLAVEENLHEALPYDPSLVVPVAISSRPLRPQDPASFSLISFRLPPPAPTIPLSRQEPGETNDVANAILKPTQPIIPSMSVPPSLPPPSMPQTISTPPPLPPPSRVRPVYTTPVKPPPNFYALPERPEGEPNGINSALIALSEWSNVRSLDDRRQDGLLDKMFAGLETTAYPVFGALQKAQADELIMRLTGTKPAKYELDFGHLNYSKSCAEAFVKALHAGNALFPVPSNDVAERWLASGVRDHSERPDMTGVLNKICTTELFLSGRFDKVVPDWPWVAAADSNPRDEIPPNGVRNPSPAEWEAAREGYAREGLNFRPANPVIAFFARLVCNRQLSDIARLVYDGQPRRTRFPMKLFSVEDLIAYLQELVHVFERWTPVFPLPEPSAAPGTAWKLTMAERMEARFFAAIEAAMPEITRPRDGLRTVIKWKRNQTASEFAVALRAVLRDQHYCASPDVLPEEPATDLPSAPVIKVKKQQQPRPVGTPMERFLRQSIVALGGDPNARKDDIARIIATLEQAGAYEKILKENAKVLKIHDNNFLTVPCPVAERMNRDKLAALPLPEPGSLGIYEGVRHLLFPYAIGSDADREFLSRSFDWTNTTALEYGWWHVFLQEVAAHAKTTHICSLDSLGRPLAVYVETAEDHRLRKSADTSEAYAEMLRDVIKLNGEGTTPKENMAFLKPWPYATARWGPHNWLHQVDGRTECTAEKPWMPVVVSQHPARDEGHRTLLLINRSTGVAYYFEPNGDGNEAELAFVVPTVRAFLVRQGTIDAERDMRHVVVLQSPEHPGAGPQIQQNRHGNIVLEDHAGTCVIWSQLFFHLFIINPQLSPEQIIQAMLERGLLSQLGMIVSRYAMWLAESSEKTITAVRGEE
ncbi:hypothetical protein [Medusavirus stheno T3]|uniref:Uncharacterized protein n=1 Tax=Medusavirus stheno T3 TaxID=3069717 RepID=A0A7S8BEJ8_9VIRU|nr:hypothetical protein QKU73_gp413 [Acanthamoeba castellanii medusavirus]QPB44362.1 hypothetical protein [Medusavirus stheno T3]